MTKGLIFDYGGTIDSKGTHWSWIIRDAYSQNGVNIDLEPFRETYVEGERELARHRHVLPGDNFLQVMKRKMEIHRLYLAQKGYADITAQQADDIANTCYQAARNCVDEAKPTIEALSQRFPLMLVSNFYGNIDTVLRDFDIRHLFKGIIESAMVGVRKPDPTIFRLGVDALQLDPQDVMVVGDSVRKDILPAQSLGCQTVWVKGKPWTDDENRFTHPRTITSLAEITQFLPEN